MSHFVSPSPVISDPKLILPTTTYKLIITERVSIKGAYGNFPGQRVLTIGFDRVMIIIVAGITSTEVYLTEDAKTVFSSSGSFCGLTFAKVGNKAVAIGMVKNVKRIVK